MSGLAALIPMPKDTALHFSLIGLPGSGKSTIGRHLSRVWDIPFVDTDHVIEQRLGCSIKDYFASHGEAAFRDMESEVLAQLLAQPQSSVISTGGGAILRTQNRAVLKAHSTVFYLQASPEDIARRLRSDTTRPLLQGDDPLKRLRSLFTIRSPLYLETAHYVIDSIRQNTVQVTRKICMQAELAGILPSKCCGKRMKDVN